MAINIPTIAEIKQRIIDDFTTEYGQTIPILSRAFLRVYASVAAGAHWLNYKFAQRVSLNILPTTAKSERLDDFAALIDLQRQSAVAWQGTATTTGTDGQIIRAGTIYIGANGIDYLVTADSTIAAGTATLFLTAQTASAESQLSTGAILTILNPLPGVATIATWASTITDGQDREDDDSFQQKIIDDFKLRPQGGARQDYIRWAQTVTGVTRVFPYDGGAGVVDLYFLRDNDIDRIPDASEIAAVISAIDQPLRRPLGASLVVAAPTERIFSVVINGFLPNTVSVKDLVKSDIETYFLEREMFVSSNVSKVNINKINKFDIFAIIGNFGTASSVQMYESTNPAVDISYYDLQKGEVAKTTVTFA